MTQHCESGRQQPQSTRRQRACRLRQFRSHNLQNRSVSIGSLVGLYRSVMVMVLATSKRINVAPDVREDPKLEWPELWNQLTLDIVSNYRAGRSREGSLLSWSFKLSQPLRITSGLRETFIKRYPVERINQTNKTRRTE